MAEKNIVCPSTQGGLFRQLLRAEGYRWLRIAIALTLLTVPPYYLWESFGGRVEHHVKHSLLGYPLRNAKNVALGDFEKEAERIKAGMDKARLERLRKLASETSDNDAGCEVSWLEEPEGGDGKEGVGYQGLHYTFKFGPGGRIVSVSRSYGCWVISREW